jgi:murein DD-endopeptidase MepM/ murein hydrolase activator NlpD
VRLPNRYGILVLVVAACGFWAVWSRREGLVAFILACTALLGLVLYERFNYAASKKKWIDRASRNPIVLQPPFADRWYVAAGGPDPRRNHHVAVSDQYFAYDFLREDGDSWDQPILAPCNGMIVHVENRQDDAPPGERRRDGKRPFGNYVSIQTSRGYVILAHLKRGSVTVRVGESVRAGDPIGRCGNSGNTRGAHLHLHAQDQPSQSVDVANGIPVAFTDRSRGEPLLLEYGDRLG